MDALLRDIRYAVKLLLKEKTFSATVLATLALCLGANVTIYSAVNAVLLEPLPFPDPGRLVTVYQSYPGAGAARASNSVPDYFYRRERIEAFAEVAAMQPAGATVGEAGSTERVSEMRVTPSFFPLLGVDAALGRTFTEDEIDVGNHEKAILTHAWWQEYFGGVLDVVGRELRVDGRPYRIVGVLVEDFRLPFRDEPRFFVPLAFPEEQRTLESWHSNNVQIMARLAPGASVEQAVAQNQALNEAMIDGWPVPNARQLLQDAGFRTVIVPTADDLVRDLRSVLYLLQAGVAFVLLIGCVNIANLLLARAQSRAGEWATRLALGAARVRVARQVLTEAAVMAALGGVLGVAVGAIGVHLLETLGATDIPRGTEIGIDGAVLAFTAVLTVGAALLFGSIPVVQLMRGDLSTVFRTEGRSGTASRRAVLVRNGLVTSQVALAFVLLIGAGLMLASFRTALAVDPGFDPDGVLTAFLSLPEARYEGADSRRQFVDELLQDVRAIPGIERASVTSQLPFSGNNSSSVITPEGYVPGPGESLLSPYQTRVSPGYFASLDIDVLEGRTFEDADGPDATRVIVIDEWLAERYWPDRSPIGDRMVYGAIPGMDSIPADAFYTVVGVVETIKQNDLTAPEAEHVGAYYFSVRQQVPAFYTLVVRTAGDPNALAQPVRAALNRIDPELPLYGVQPMGARIDESLAARRIPLFLLGVFALVALFLAVIGIYGALAYSVSQRRREIGIRMAMGSAPAAVFGAVVRQGVTVTVFGLVIGGVAAFFLTRLIQSLLFGVGTSDPVILAGVAAILGGVGVLASALPARRATRVDPVTVLGS